MIKRKTILEKEEKPKAVRQKKLKVPNFEELQDLILVDESGKRTLKTVEKNVRVAFERPVYNSIEIHVGTINEVNIEKGSLTLIDESKGEQFYGINFLTYPHKIKLLSSI